MTGILEPLSRNEVLHTELLRASVRHQIVRRFADRMHQAFAVRGANPMFISGWLFGPDGRSLQTALLGDGLWTDQGAKIGFVYSNGPVEVAMDNTRIAGFIVDGGAIVDEAGDTLALLEFATGSAVPDDFLTVEVEADPRARTPSGEAGDAVLSRRAFELPAPTGHWSAHSLMHRLTSREW